MLPWTGGNLTSVSYIISQESTLRISGVATAVAVNDLLTKLRYLWYLDPAWTDPNVAKPPLTADDGQGMLRISTGQLWVMQGGTWVAAGTFEGFNFTGAWSGATVYNTNDVATLGGSAYICILAHTNHTPPNATYWSVLASIGATGATGSTGPAAWSPPRGMGHRSCICCRASCQYRYTGR